jgi:hypothetical protein
MSYNTGNPIGSTDARDLLDNAKNFDRALNSTEPTWVDRFGVTRTTVPKAFADIAADVTAVDDARIAAQSAIAADVNAVESAKTDAIDEIADKVAEVDPVVAATYVGQAEAARDAAALSASAAADSAAQAADAVDDLRDDLAAPGGSGEVWHMPSGIGVIAASVKAMLDRSAYIFPENFGALGTPVDDTAAFEKVRAHLALSGGLVFLSKLYLTASPFVLPSSSGLVGAGLHCGIQNVSSGDSTPVEIGDIQNWLLKDLMLKGGYGIAASGQGIKFTNANDAFDMKAFISNVLITDCKNDGFQKITSKTVSSIVIHNLRIRRCGGMGFRTNSMNDLKFKDIDIAYCHDSGMRVVGYNVEGNAKVWACRVSSFVDLSAENVPPTTATEAADVGAVILGGGNHKLMLEIQENGSIGLQLGDEQACAWGMNIDVIADGNGGYSHSADAPTKAAYSRVGVLLKNYYGCTINGVCDDFRARVGRGRQRSGVRSVGTKHTWTSGSLVRGDYFRIANNSGGADFTNLQVGNAAPSNAVGTVFQARADGFGVCTPESWGTGILEAVNDNISVNLAIRNQVDQNAGTGPGYDFSTDGGNSSISVIGGEYKLPNIKLGNIAASDPNTLDHYNRSQALVVVAGTSTSGTATYANQTFRYIKVGRNVTFTIRVNFSGHTGTGNIKIVGLPFAASGAGAGIAVVNVYSVSGLAFTGPCLSGYIQGNELFVRQIAETGAGTGVPIPAAADFYVSGSYESTQ